ncbi:MAG: hypothetical protein WDW38_006037 [Sanguina aurantia]
MSDFYVCTDELTAAGSSSQAPVGPDGLKWTLSVNNTSDVAWVTQEGEVRGAGLGLGCDRRGMSCASAFGRPVSDLCRHSTVGLETTLAHAELPTVPPPHSAAHSVTSWDTAQSVLDVIRRPCIGPANMFGSCRGTALMRRHASECTHWARRSRELGLAA